MVKSLGRVQESLPKKGYSTRCTLGIAPTEPASPLSDRNRECRFDFGSYGAFRRNLDHSRQFLSKPSP